MNIFIINNSDFELLSGRKHVLGACILNQMYDLFSASQPFHSSEDFHIRYAKFKQKTACNGQLILSSGADEKKSVDDAVAEIKAISGGVEIRGWFVPVANWPVERNDSMEENIRDVSISSGLSGICKVSSMDRVSTLRSLVEATKQVQLLSGKTRSWSKGKVVSELLFIEDFTLNSGLNSIDTLVEVKNIGSRIVNDRLTTMNLLSFENLQNKTVNLKIAMSFYSV